MGCERYLGLPFRLGGTGEDGTIDCIHLVYRCLRELQIPTPQFEERWYTYPKIEISRTLLQWGKRVDHPLYDGDVVLMAADSYAFGVTWEQGILHISRLSHRVDWCPIGAQGSSVTFRPYFRMNES